MTILLLGWHCCYRRQAILLFLASLIIYSSQEVHEINESEDFYGWQLHCSRRGQKMVVPHSSKDLMAKESFNSFYYVGLVRNYNIGGLWHNIYTGDIQEFFQWDGDEPSNNTNFDCVVVNRNSGLMRVKSCLEKYALGLCELDIISRNKSDESFVGATIPLANRLQSKPVKECNCKRASVAALLSILVCLVLHAFLGWMLSLVFVPAHMNFSVIDTIWAFYEFPAKKAGGARTIGTAEDPDDTIGIMMGD